MDANATPVQRDCFPYSPAVYLCRIFWRIVWYTVWRMVNWRIPGVRSGMLRMFGARVGRGAQIKATAWVEMPWQLTLGERCLIGSRVNIYSLGTISIGDDTVISQGAHLCAGTHDYTDPSFPLQRCPIRIGKQVWIAADAFVGPGVTIGDGAVVGARAVVTKDVEPWTIVGGNPARPIKKREMGAGAA